MIKLRPRIIPCLLLADGALVKTIKFRKPNYLGDPINAVKIFNEKEVDELCLMDICASKQGMKPDFELLTNIASEAFMPLSYGGGITCIEEIQTLFKIGFEKVIINTCFIDNPNLLVEAVKLAGSQSIVVSIDVKETLLSKYVTYIAGGTKKTNRSPIEVAKMAEQLGAGEIIINSIDRDGMMQGYDIKLVKSIAETVNIPVVACGGAGKVSDLRQVIYEGNDHAASAGSLFVYYGKKKAVLINFPTEDEFIKEGVYKNE